MWRPIDQGGMALPGRSFYLDQDDKAKEIRAKYVQHVTNIFALAGEKPEQAKSDAATVLEIETELAKGAMDPVARRDPKNLNNPMTLAQGEGADAVVRLGCVLQAGEVAGDAEGTS